MKKTKTLFIVIFAFALIYNPFTIKMLCKKYAKKYNLNSKFFINQIKAESSFWAFAESKTGNIGLGQLHPGTAKFLQKTGYKKIYLYLPWYNLNTSAKYMRYLLNKYKNNYSLALAAYNWGEGNVDLRINKVGITVKKEFNYSSIFEDISETYNYLNKIFLER